MSFVKLLLASLSFFFFVGCSVPEFEPQPEPPPYPLFGEEVSGIGTWYGPLFHGRVTSSGAMYDMNKFSVSHRNYPMGSILEVSNPDNGKKIMVVVNDRNNLDEGIDICLSRRAAKELGVYPKKKFKVIYMMIE